MRRQTQATQLNSNTRPKHIAIICDGNRTWARKQGKPAGFGHKQGMKTVEKLIEAGIRQEIPYLTFWIFSTENWRRSKAEVSLLFNLFRRTFKRLENQMDERGVRLNFIGNLAQLPQDMQDLIERGQHRTKDNHKITVTFAISYGGRDEIIRAVNKFIIADKKIHPLTQEKLEQYLDTSDLPNPDLIVRTGGHYRLSGFMLWQLNYAELYFPKINFPDFDGEELKKAIQEFTSRQRKFGK